MEFSMSLDLHPGEREDDVISDSLKDYSGSDDVKDMEKAVKKGVKAYQDEFGKDTSFTLSMSVSGETKEHIVTGKEIEYVERPEFMIEAVTPEETETTEEEAPVEEETETAPLEEETPTEDSSNLSLNLNP
jgi:hypothetical protein